MNDIKRMKKAFNSTEEEVVSFQQILNRIEKQSTIHQQESKKDQMNEKACSVQTTESGSVRRKLDKLEDDIANMRKLLVELEEKIRPVLFPNGGMPKGDEEPCEVMCDTAHRIHLLQRQAWEACCHISAILNAVDL